MGLFSYPHKWLQTSQGLLYVYYVSPSWHIHLIGQSTPFGIWSALNQIFWSQSHTKRMKFEFLLYNTKKLGKPMRKCIAEFGHIYDTLSSCEQVISGDVQQSTILYGLPLEYENIVSIVTTSQQSDDLPGWCQLC